MRGIVYGIGALSVPVAWAWGARLAAVAIAVIVLFGLAGEIAIQLRR